MLDDRPKQKGLLFYYKTYLALHSGGLHHPDWIRHRVVFIQMFTLMFVMPCAFLWDYWVLNTGGLSWLIATLWSLGCWLVTLYFTAGLFLSLRDNLPKMVSTKNTLGLFLFTLLFFEAGILCFLFWFLGIALWATGTPLCRGELCTGLINGLFAYVNVLAGICIISVLRARKSLGIGILDAFGL